MNKQIELNDNHRRALSSVLQIVEQTLNDFTQIIANAQLPAERSQAVLQKIAGARQKVKEFRSRFKIPNPRRRDPVWAIQVRVSRLWEMLEDCKSEPLRGYGEVPKDTKSALDTEVQNLINLFESIAAAARGNS